MYEDPGSKQVRACSWNILFIGAVVLSRAVLHPTRRNGLYPGKLACAPGSPLSRGGYSLAPFSQQERGLQGTPKSARCRSARRAKRAWGRLSLRWSKADIWLGRTRLAPLAGPFQGLVLGRQQGRGLACLFSPKQQRTWVFLGSTASTEAQAFGGLL